MSSKFDGCVRCGREFDAADSHVQLDIHSTDLGLTPTERTHHLCGECYGKYLDFVHS